MRNALTVLFLAAFVGEQIGAQQRGKEEPAPPARTEALPKRPESVDRAAPAGDLPSSYWASSMKPGDVAFSNGLLRLKEPTRKPKRVFLAGIPLDAQPTFDLTPITNDGTTAAMIRLRRQKQQYLDWAARYFGRSLSGQGRLRLRSLYRATSDSVQAITKRKLGRTKEDSATHPRDSATSVKKADEMRLRLAKALTKSVLAEHRLFQGNQRAQKERYGKALLPMRELASSDTARIVSAIESWLRHDRDTIAATRKPRVKELPTPIITITCRSPDTLITTGFVGWQALNYYEARFYVAKHDASDMVALVREFYGIDIDFAYHSSIGTGVWQLFKGHKVTVAHFVPGQCLPFTPMPAGMAQYFAALAGHDSVVWADTSTVWEMRPLGWYLANGASGVYHSTAHGVQDEMEPVFTASFSSYDSMMDWLYSPLPDDDGNYYRMRVVDYSIGDYGFDWICHSVVNAYSLWRWYLTPIVDPVDYEAYSTYGNNGIAPPGDMWGNRHYGCVPGHDCYYTTSYWYSGFSWFFESRLFGEGWGLGIFFKPSSNSWQDSTAGFYSVQPLWDMSIDSISELPGWH
jgi:hypothetical protein